MTSCVSHDSSTSPFGVVHVSSRVLREPYLGVLNIMEYLMERPIQSLELSILLFKVFSVFIKPELSK